MSAPALRAILYDRVSTVVQSKSGYSGGADGFQLDRCRAYLDAHNLTCVGVLTDVDSGAKWQINGVMEAIDRAKRGEYDVLVVSDTSRFARSFGKKVVYEAELERYGVTVAYTNLPNLPTENTPETRLTKNIMGGVYGALDEYDRDKRTWWTSQGRRKKAQVGRVVGSGPPPYGLAYVKTWDEAKQKHIPHDFEPVAATAPVVERLYREITTTVAVQLAARLMTEGVPTPNGGTHWHHSTIREILKNPVYRGEWSYAGTPVPVRPLVSYAVWHEAQRALTARKGVRTRGRRQLEDGDDPWLLRGKLRCGHCGGLLCTNSNPAVGWQDGRQRRYLCGRAVPAWAKRSGWKSCPGPLAPLLSADERRRAEHDVSYAQAVGRPADPHQLRLVGMEQLAWEAVAAIFADEDLFAAKLQALHDRDGEASAAWTARLADLDAEISTHERLMRRAEEEKLKLEPDDERYRIHDEAGLRASETVKRLNLDRERYVAEPVPWLSASELSELVKLSGAVRTLVQLGIEHPLPEDQRRIYALLRLSGRVYRDDEHGQRVGRDSKVRVEWETILDSGHGFLKLCLLSTGSGISLERLDRLARVS